jgi:hypothetical protein
MEQQTRAQLFQRSKSENSADTGERSPAMDAILPFLKKQERKGTAIDEALGEKLGREGLLRMKAMEYTMEFLSVRGINDPEKIEQLYDLFYNKIKNGISKARPKVHQQRFS